MSAPVQCPRCRAWLLEGVFNQPELAPCPACGVPLQAEIFPAFFRRPVPGQSGQAVLFEGEAGCFYHPRKKAVVPCAGCGRFLCALCDCELNGQHLCPACLERGKTRGKIKSLEHQRTLHGNIAFALALYPVVLIFGLYFTIITAPLALFVAIRYWRAPRSLVRPHPTRHVLAITLASLELCGWGFLIFEWIHHLPA